MKKLEHYGVRGVSNQWFKSYLSNRHQFVTIQNTHSNLLPISCGVPQGSILGPLLFLIYINDLNEAIKNSVVHHFADDTNLFNRKKSLENLIETTNLDLNELCNWLKANQLNLNVSFISINKE